MKQAKIFDVDGTISAFVPNPSDSILEQDFIDYVVPAEKEDPGSHIILTGREDGRVNPKAESYTVDKILKPVLDQVPLTVISSHGLACVTPDGVIHMHPVLENVLPNVKQLHDAVADFHGLHPSHNIVFEKKLTGVTVNVNLVSEEADKVAVLKSAKEHFAPFIEGSDLVIADEHGSIEVRPKVGKKDGLEHFIAQGLVPKEAAMTFFCDSLGPQGTDRSLADDFVANGHEVIQVLNGKSAYGGAARTYANPGELSYALKSGYSKN